MKITSKGQVTIPISPRHLAVHLADSSVILGDIAIQP